MPFDPTPVGDQYFSSIRWDEKGNPYQVTQSGKRSYIPPASAVYADQSNPIGIKLREWAAKQGATSENPSGRDAPGGFSSSRGTWNSNKGGFDHSFWNSSLGGLILGGGMMAAGPAMGAFLGPAATTTSGVTAAGGVAQTGVPTTMFGAPAANFGAAGTTAATGAGMGNLYMQGAGIGMNFLGNYLSGQGQQEMSDQQILAMLLQTQQSREDAQRMALANYLAGESQADRGDANVQAGRGLEATQMDPYAHAKAKNSANVKRSFMEGTGGNPNQRMSGGFDMSALSPENLTRNEDYFYSNVAAAQPNVPLEGMGSGKAESFRQNFLKTSQSDRDSMRKKIMEYLSQMGGPVQNYPTLPSRD